MDDCAFGKFNNYPEDIINPAFGGMLVWELTLNHVVNDFRINRFHNIRSCVILRGAQAYIFTPLSNDDIHLYIEILFRDKKLRNDVSHSKAATT